MSMNRKPSVLHDLLREWPYAADKTSLVRAQLDRRDPIDQIEEEEVGRLLHELTDEGPELRPTIAAALSNHRWRHAAGKIGGAH
jgi:DnaJ-domain-containing protein 1